MISFSVESAYQAVVIRSLAMLAQATQQAACTELEPQGPNEKDADEQGHDKGLVKAELCNQRQLHSNGPRPTHRWPIVLAAKAMAGCHSPRVAS